MADIPNINKTRISVVTKPTNVSVSTAGIQGKAGFTQDLSSLNDFTASYYIDSASIINLIQQATNEQDLSNYAVLNGGNNFTGNQFISGSVTISNRLNFATGSFINSQIQIEAFLTNYTLLEIVNYSSSSIDDLEASTYNLTNGVPAPWTAFRLGAASPIPVTSIEVNDILAGTSIIPSVVQAKGGSGFTDIVVVNLDLTGLLQILPLTGSNFQLLRPLVKPALTIQTPNGTDIFLNSQGLGDTITNTNVVPLVTAQNKLGLPTRRWKEIWVASGSIYMQDETLGIDLRMTARDGNFVVDGAAGLKVGEFTLRDNSILLSNPNRDIIVGTEQATGKFILNRAFEVNSIFGTGSFDVTRDGLTKIYTPKTILGTQSALSIVGAKSGYEQPRNFSGSLLQLTAQDNQNARISIDSFGTGSYSVVAARVGRGTVDAPLQTKAGDTILRFTGQGWHNNNAFVGSIVRLDLEAAEDFTTTRAGTRIRFQTTPIGSNVIQTSAIIDTNGLIVPNIPTNNTATQVLVWDSISGRIGKQSGANNLDGGAAASVYLSVTEELNGGGA